jgi:hypothetical protein
MGYVLTGGRAKMLGRRGSYSNSTLNSLRAEIVFARYDDHRIGSAETTGPGHGSPPCRSKRRIAQVTRNRCEMAHESSEEFHSSASRS